MSPSRKPRSPEPTARQTEVLAAIRTLTAAHGYSPTLREIASAIGSSSTQGVSDMLAGLQKKGALRFTAGVARSVVLTEAGGADAAALERIARALVRMEAGDLRTADGLAAIRDAVADTGRLVGP